MLRKEVIEFCEDNCISIDKFLKDNFELMTYPSKKEKRIKKNRIKHEGIKDLPNVIKVPLPFAFRYKKLVKIGKLIIVRDDFGKYQAYINPCIIISTYILDDLKEKLDNLDSTLSDNLDTTLKEQQIVQLINDIEENIRIINHFHGDKTREKCCQMIDLLDELDPPSLIRKKG